MLDDFERADCLEKARAIWSMWEGHLERPDQQELKSALTAKGIPLIPIHTSGHASVADFKRLAAAISPKALIPIHTFGRDAHAGLFDNVMVAEDGKWVGV